VLWSYGKLVFPSYETRTTGIAVESSTINSLVGLFAPRLDGCYTAADPPTGEKLRDGHDKTAEVAKQWHLASSFRDFPGLDALDLEPHKTCCCSMSPCLR